MKKQKNGGPAFARSAYYAPDDGFSNDEQRGMTLRDYFAAKAMAALLVNYDGSWDDCLVRDAFACADQMLKERDKEVDSTPSP